MEDAKFLSAFQENNKPLERMGWKNMDMSQFSQTFLPLLKSMAKVSCLMTKSKMRASLRLAKLQMTPCEEDLLLEKLKNTFTWIRRRLRDAGSGAHLPAEVRAIGRIWGKAKAGKERKKVEKQRKKEEPSEEDEEQPTDIRQIFGLSPKKKKVAAVEVLDSDSESIPDAGAASSSTPANAVGSAWGPKNHDKLGNEKLPSLPRKSQQCCRVVCHSPGSTSSVGKFIYYDIYNLQAVCMKDDRTEVRVPLIELEGQNFLWWEASPGEFRQSEVPKKFRTVVMKKPSARKEKPEDEGKEQEEDQKQEEMEEEEQEEEEENEEEENEEEENEEEANEEEVNEEEDNEEEEHEEEDNEEEEHEEEDNEEEEHEEEDNEEEDNEEEHLVKECGKKEGAMKEKNDGQCDKDANVERRTMKKQRRRSRRESTKQGRQGPEW